MSDPNVTAEGWAASVAAVAVDALVDAGLVAREQFATARTVVAEEVLVRLCVRDYPPPVDDATIGHAIAAWREQRHAEPVYGPESQWDVPSTGEDFSPS